MATKVENRRLILGILVPQARLQSIKNVTLAKIHRLFAVDLIYLPF
jgi:hypothetical protein